MSHALQHSFHLLGEDDLEARTALFDALRGRRLGRGASDVTPDGMFGRELERPRSSKRGSTEVRSARSTVLEALRLRGVVLGGVVLGGVVVLVEDTPALVTTFVMAAAAAATASSCTADCSEAGMQSAALRAACFSTSFAQACTLFRPHDDRK